MVWGMSLPSGFGEFWPLGGFEGRIDGGPADGWGNRLRLHYLAQPEEEQRRLYDYGSQHAGYGAGHYPFYVSQKFISEPGSVVNPDRPPLSPIESHEPPQCFDIERGGKNLGSLIKLNDRVLAVDETLKLIIERLEPGVHQFFPIEIKQRNGKSYPARYFTLVIGQYLDSFEPESSSPESYRKDGERRFFHEETKKEMAGLAFSKVVFGKAHLWRERRLSGEWLTCFSDELQAEIANAGLRIPKHYRMREI